jgi:hypothetical protein
MVLAGNVWALVNEGASASAAAAKAMECKQVMVRLSPWV